MVPCLFLVPGMGVSPSRSVLTFVNTEEAAIVALFQQKALQVVRIGALMVNVHSAGETGRVSARADHASAENALQQAIAG